jgi:hypothetical protein
MAYGIFRSDNMSGTDVGKDLVSVKYMGAGSTATAIENGNVVLLDGLVSGERELWKGVTPAADSVLADVVVIAAPEVLVNEHEHNLDEFINAAGAYIRGYRLTSKSTFSVTADALNIGSGVTPAVGYVVELMAAVTLNVVASLTGGSTKVGEITAIETVGSYTYYVIEVV